MKSHLKWSLLWNLWLSSDTSKAWLALNTFTLHFPIENVLQSTQSSLKWSLLWNLWSSSTLERHGWLWIHSLFISRSKTFSRVPNLLWNEVFSETRGRLRTLGTLWRRGWLWIHSLFISWSKTFSRVPNLLWNEDFSEMKSSLKLVVGFELLEGVVGFENIHSSFPPRVKTFSRVPNLLWNPWSSLTSGVVSFEYIHSSFPDWKRSPVYPIFSEMKSSLKPVAVFQLLVRPALDFPDRLEFFSSLNSSQAWSWLSWSTWIFFVFESMVVVHSKVERETYISHGGTFPIILGRILPNQTWVVSHGYHAIFFKTACKVIKVFPCYSS